MCNRSVCDAWGNGAGKRSYRNRFRRGAARAARDSRHLPGRSRSERRRRQVLRQPDGARHPPAHSDGSRETLQGARRVALDARRPHGAAARLTPMAKRRTPAVTREAAEAAVRTLLRWAGDDPAREGLRDTPSRVAAAYEEWFGGYRTDPADYLRRTFEEVGGYDEMVVLRDIAFESHCEHHLAPIIGRVHVGYLPTDKVVGISKLARVVEGYARRLQVQE